MISRLTLPAYLTATAASLFGNASIAIVLPWLVLPWLVLQRTGDPALAGTVAAVSAAPGAIAAFVGGHLIDKVGRRRMSVLSDAGSAVAVAGLAIVDAAVGLNVGWFIALGVLGALFDVPGMTARETLMANVSETSGVPLDKVSALRGALFGVSFLAGPAVAGGLLATLPAIQVVWVTAACSAVAAVAIAVMPLAAAEPGADPRGHSPAEASPLADFAHIRRSPALTGLLIVNLASMILTGPLLSVVLPAHFTALNAPGLLGLALSAYAVGTIAGSGLFGWAFGGRRWLAWVVAQALFVVSAALIATLTGFWLVAGGMLAAGIGSGLLQPIVTVVLTRHVPDALRGRVFGAYSALAMVVSPIGLGLMAAILAAADLRIGAWVLAAGWLLAGAYAVIAPGLRGYIEGNPDEEASVVDHQTAR